MRLEFSPGCVRVSRCNIFGEDASFNISLHGRKQDDFLSSFDAWSRGTLIQDAFSWLNNDEREFLISGITPNQWNSLFGDMGEDDSGL